MTTEQPSPADKYEYVVLVEGAKHYVALRQFSNPEWLQIVATFRDSGRAEEYACVENDLASDEVVVRDEARTKAPNFELPRSALGELLRIVQKVTETRLVEMRTAPAVAACAPPDRETIAVWRLEVIKGNTDLGLQDWALTHRWIPHEEAAAALPVPAPQLRLPKHPVPPKTAVRPGPPAFELPPPPASEIMPPEQATSPIPAPNEVPAEEELAKAALGDAPAPPSTAASRILAALPGLLEEFPKGPTANTFCQRLGLSRNHVDKAIADLGPSACVVRRLDTGGKHVVPADYKSPPEELSGNQQAVYSALCCGVNERGIVSISKERLALVASIPPASVKSALDGLSAKGRLMVAGGGLGALVYQVIDEKGEVVAPLAPPPAADEADAPAPTQPEDGVVAVAEEPAPPVDGDSEKEPPPAPPLPPPRPAPISSAWREPPKGKSEKSLRPGDAPDKIIVDFGAGQARLNGAVCFIAGRPLAIINEIYRRAPKPVEHGNLVEEVFPEHKRTNAKTMVDSQIQVANDRLRGIGAHIKTTSKGYVLEPVETKATRGA